jgi:glucose/arabinose dehydrogenase
MENRHRSTGKISNSIQTDKGFETMLSKTHHQRRVWPLMACLAIAIGLFFLWNGGFVKSAAGMGKGQEPISQPSAAWPTISLQEIASGLDSPVHLTHAGDGSGRIFVVEQPGRIRIIKGGQVLSTPFLDINGRVLSGGERGLLSVAFPPQYATKGYFYVYYTNQDGNNQVSRFHLSTNPDVADSGSEELILLLPHPTYSNHNGGQLAFGPDGYLYIGTGDGGGGGDPFGNAQNPDALLGKLLRIDVEPAATASINLTAAVEIYLPMVYQYQKATGPAYKIPPDNPFVDMQGYRSEIWALGLRNPWRFSFDRQTGDVYIGDVGQDRMEEVDFQPAASSGGENYGWNILEGTLCYEPSSGCVPPANYSPPVAEYEHGTNDSNGCSITGGFIYRGTTYASMQGIYFFADYCKGKVWGLQQEAGTWITELLIPSSSYNITSFGEDQEGELYVVAQEGKIFKVVTP